MRKVLVTGAAGRVGQQLLDGLRERFDLRLMDRVPVVDADGGARVLVGELTDRRLLNDAVAGVDAVVHLAGNPDPEASWQDLRDPNVEGFAGLLAVSRDWPRAGCGRSPVDPARPHRGAVPAGVGR